MRFIADFHIHSHFSIATSRDLVPERLEYWARVKGIDVLGTGDCVHPGWYAELAEKLEPAGNGLYRLRDEYRLEETRRLPGADRPGEVFFILTGEISSIYRKDGRTRKVHNLCVFPDFEAAGRLQERLDRAGNIRSDGRPILGLDSKIILEMTLESSPCSFLVPCHIWTPWFSVLGSRSGFDSIEECYEDLTPHIHALETGLSSDPPMNRVCSILDRYIMISNSDAHSPEKLGREANLFDTELSYGGIRGALNGSPGFTGTIEFFPQEGKYHYDGHRSCGVRWDPLETVRHGGACPECGKQVTRGVMYRVAELSDRAAPPAAPGGAVFRSITPLPELLSELAGGKAPGSKAVKREYQLLAGTLASEFHILLDAPLDQLREAGGDLLAEAVRRLRCGEVRVEEGFDGEFGRVRVFGPGEIGSLSGGSLFDERCEAGPGHAQSSIAFDIEGFRELRRDMAHRRGDPAEIIGANRSTGVRDVVQEPTDGQREAIGHDEGPCMVIAGPGTGKTAVLAGRVLHLVRERGVPPGEVLALTFSNRAAEEMRSRIERLLGGEGATISTFHSFGLGILRERCGDLGRDPSFTIAEEPDIEEIIEGLAANGESVPALLRRIDAFKQGRSEDRPAEGILDRYDSALREMNAFDLNDLVFLPVRIFEADPALLAEYRERYRWLLVDEFQDINAVQFRFLSLLAGEGSPNIFIIGDPDQAIYGFRGSDVRFLDRFRDEWPSARVIGLDRSFRCPGTVIRAGAEVLGRSESIAGRDHPVKVRVQELRTGRSEADWIASAIEKSIGGVRSFSIDSGVSDGEAESTALGFADFAVLCRASFLFPDLLEAFSNHGVPCQVVGSESLFGREPCRGVVGSLKRLFIGGSDRRVSAEVAGDVRGMIEKGDGVAEVLGFLMVILETPEEASHRLARYAREFGADYPAFFRSLALRQGMDDRDGRAEAVSLMTIHAAKGLEFDTVFIPACEKGIIPFEIFGRRTEEEYAEEARLFYVGITRTMNRLFLSHAASRSVRGRLMKLERSPFLERLEEELLERGKRPGRVKRGSRDGVQLDLFGDEAP